VIAVRLLWRQEVKEYLDEFGCELIEELENSDDPYYRSSYWRTSWGFHFFVPEIGPDRLCPEHLIYSILAEISERKPSSDD
jgi:hypothetical protein